MYNRNILKFSCHNTSQPNLKENEFVIIFLLQVCVCVCVYGERETCKKEIHQFLVIECQPQELHSREKMNRRCPPSGVVNSQWINFWCEVIRDETLSFQHPIGYLQLSQGFTEYPSQLRFSRACGMEVSNAAQSLGQQGLPLFLRHHNIR